MKKLLSLVLALALVFTFAVSAFAATTFSTTVTPDYATAADKMDEITGKTQEDVHINVNADTRAIYRVDLVWEPMDFEYVLGAWDTDAHRYSTDGAHWVDDSSDIVITNHSNRNVKYNIALSDVNNYNGAKFALSKDNGIIDYVVEAGDDTAEVVSDDTITVTVSGDPKSTVKDVVIGKITITFTGLTTQGTEEYDANALDVPAGWRDVHESANYDRSAVEDLPPVVTP